MQKKPTTARNKAHSNMSDTKKTKVKVKPTLDLHITVTGKEPCMPVLIDFIRYCGNHPEQRFWQALRNWAEVPFILVTYLGGPPEDTFYWKGRRK